MGGGRLSRLRGHGRQPYRWPTEGPRPGDPRSAGPRPRGTFRDGAWLALTSTLIVVTVLQVIRLVWTLLTSDQVQVSGGRAFIGFVITVVWLLTIFWLTAGAWRRSVWGCPFEHTTDAHYDRRCRRHAFVAAGAAPPEVRGGPADTGPKPDAAVTDNST